MWKAWQTLDRHVMLLFMMRYLLILMIGCCFSARSLSAGAPSNKISDKDLAEIDGLQRDCMDGFDSGSVTMFEVKEIERLANRAHYLHGDITKDAFLKKSDQLSEEMKKIFSEAFAVGAIPKPLPMRKSIYEGIIEDHALP